MAGSRRVSAPAGDWPAGPARRPGLGAPAARAWRALHRAEAEPVWAWLDRLALLVLALAAPVLLFPGPWSLASLAAIGMTWIARKQARGYWTVRTFLDRPALVLLAMTAVGLTVSVDLGPSLNRATVLLLGLAIFYGVANGVHSEGGALHLGLLLIPAGALAALAALAGTDWSLGALAGLPQPTWIYDHLPRLLAHIPASGLPPLTDLFHPRIVAGTMAFLLPVPLAFAWRGARGPGRTACALLAALMFGTLLLTQSPQGLVGLAAGLLVLAAPALRRRPRRALALLAPVAAGALLLVVLPAPLQHRLLFAVTGRLEIWREAAYMIRDMPFTGSGLNTFPLVSDGFYTLVPDRMPHAHNVYLQTAVDFGIPGLLAFLALLAGFAGAAGRAYRAARAPDARTLVLGLAAGVAALLAFGLGDVLGLGYKPATALWVMFGLVAALDRPAAGDSSRAARAAGQPSPCGDGTVPPGGHLLVAGAGDSSRAGRACGRPSPFENGTTLSTGNPPASAPTLPVKGIRGIRLTRRLGVAALVALSVLGSAPLLGSLVSLNAASALAHRAALRGGQPPPPAAVALAAQAAAWFPGNSRAYFLLGLAANGAGRPVAAQGYLTTALRLDPGDPLAHYQLGWARYAQGDLAGAAREWRIADGGRDIRSFRQPVAALVRDAAAALRAGALAPGLRLYGTAVALVH